ncbi:MAG: phosphate-starvation-inducible PsiE family protein [Lachnospiraceae bacterium]
MKNFLKEKIKSNSFLLKTAHILEIVVGVILIAAILISIVPLISGVIGLYRSGGNVNAFQTVLGQMFNVIIGIEFLKMICRYNMDSVIEVLLFTLARQMVIEHGTPVGNLLTIIAIAVMFVIRKFLFVKEYDDPTEEKEE